MPIERVSITPAAAEMVRKMREQHGDLLFHQSGGCCDGSAPMCYPRNDFRIGQTTSTSAPSKAARSTSAAHNSSTGRTHN